MCKRLGFAILILTSPLPWRSQRVNFAHRRTLHYDPTRCYHNMQYRNSELALSLIILGIFLALRPLHCSLLPPAPGLSPDMSLTVYPTNKMTSYCNCVLVSQKKKKRPWESVYEKTYLSYVWSTEWKSTPVVFLL